MLISTSLNWWIPAMPVILIVGSVAIAILVSRLRRGAWPKIDTAPIDPTPPPVMRGRKVEYHEGDLFILRCADAVLTELFGDAIARHATIEELETILSDIGTRDRERTFNISGVFIRSDASTGRFWIDAGSRWVMMNSSGEPTGWIKMTGLIVASGQANRRFTVDRDRRGQLKVVFTNQ